MCVKEHVENFFFKKKQYFFLVDQEHLESHMEAKWESCIICMLLIDFTVILRDRV